MNVDEWVRDRMRSLDSPSGWQPSVERAMARFRERRTRNAGRARSWAFAVGGVSVAALVLVAVPSSGTCAQSVLGLKCIAPALVAPLNYKELGSKTAPITCEIYSDYECPSCADFFEHTLPLLVDKYVKTGRMRLVHRDFPLPQHAFARLAARYANAAGELGFYDIVTAQLFRTQTAWQSTGQIGVQVGQVVPPGAMLRIQKMVETDSNLDNTVAADLSRAAEDAINQTPSLVFVYGGKRQKVVPAGSFGLLSAWLDQIHPN